MACSSSAWRPKGIPGSWAHKPRRFAAGAHWGPPAGVIPRPGPAVKSTASRGRARTAPRQPWPRAAAGREIRTEARRLPVPGRTHPSGNGGGGGRAPLPLERKGSRLCQLSQLAGARLPRGRATRSSRLARCLFVSPRLPSSQTNGWRQEIGRAPGKPGSSARRGGGATRPAGSGTPPPRAPQPGRGQWGMF